MSSDNVEHRGDERMRELLAAQPEVFDEFSAVPERLFDAGDQVLAIVRAGGRARGSGVEVSAQFGHLLTIRSGKALRFREFKDPREALKAAPGGVSFAGTTITPEAARPRLNTPLLGEQALVGARLQMATRVLQRALPTL
jgi:hypothetical protein